MKKVNLLSSGATTEVYEWEQDKILKLYFDKYSQEWVNHEAKVGHIVNESGISSPDGESICHGDLYFYNIIVSGMNIVSAKYAK